MFEGTIPALVTPFKSEPRERPEIDFAALDNLVEWHLECGVSGFVVCGTTGESVTLSQEEKLALVERVRDVVRGRVPIIVGTGTNCTASTIEMTKTVRKMGVDGVLIVSPYYNKPTQEGLYQHFKAVAEFGGLPVVVYNVPGRTSVEISIETFERLAAVPNIVAVKQAVDSAGKLIALAAAVGDRVDILAGNCDLTYSVLTMGGRGVISTAANLIPKEMVEITQNGLSGNMREAFEAQKRALPIIDAVFVETNPIPIKAALAMIGRIPTDAVRLPMTRATNKTRELLARVLNIS